MNQVVFFFNSLVIIIKKTERCQGMPVGISDVITEIDSFAIWTPAIKVSLLSYISLLLS